MLEKMEQTLTHNEIDLAVAAFNQLADRSMPGAVTFALVKNRRTLLPHLQDYAEARKKIIKNYAVLDEEGNHLPVLDEDGNAKPNTVRLKPEYVEKAHEELNELEDTTLDVEIYTASVDALNDMKIEAAMLDAIHFMFT